MIALSILSTILIIATFVMIQIGTLYTKGVNAANLQNSGRNIVSDVSSALQFSGNAPSSCTAVNSTITCATATHTYGLAGYPSGETVNAICVGTTRYSFVMNSEQGTDSAANPLTGATAGATTPHVLWRDTTGLGSSCAPLNLSAATVMADGSSADATAGSPSGGYDMLPDHIRLTRFKIAPTASTGKIYGINVWMAFGDSDLVNVSGTGQPSCQGGAGTQFCSLSQISSTVAGRIY